MTQRFPSITYDIYGASPLSLLFLKKSSTKNFQARIKSIASKISTHTRSSVIIWTATLRPPIKSSFFLVGDDVLGVPLNSHSFV